MSEYNPHRILVIDDNVAIHEDFRKILAASEDVVSEADKAVAAIFGGTIPAKPAKYEIDSAYQGGEGLALVNKACQDDRPYSVAFVDIRMPPGWDGIETISRIWKIDPAMEVVICTAFSDYSPESITSRLGDTDRLLILKKPFDNIEVRQLASSLTRKWTLARQAKGHLEKLRTLVEDRTRKLEMSEEKVRLLAHTMENVQEMVVITDLEDKITFANKACLEKHGHRLEDLLGRHVTLFYSPNNRAGLHQEISTQSRRGSWTGEVTHQTRAGGEMLVSLSASNIRDEDGKFFGIVMIASDITERRRSEEALRSSENHYRLLFESNPTPVFVFDKATLRFLAVNEAAIQHYGYSKEEFLGLTLEEIGLAEEIPAFKNKLARISEDDGYAGIWRHRKKDGKLAEMEITAHELTFAGRPAWLSLAADVTERRNLEAQLRQSQKMESVGQLAGGIAHDFNNLLTVINGHAGLVLAKEQLSPQVAEPIREISEAARRAADLTRQLLTFSRKQVIQPQVVDLNEVVNNVSKMLRRILGEDIALEVTFAPSLPAIKADLSMIEQVLLNLAVNSRDAMPKGGRLCIDTAAVTIDHNYARHNPDAAEGRFVCLTCADSGCGISPENLARIFEPFFTTKAKDRGTGLGLATVYGIIKQHQGWITVESEVGKGTTFRIYLPASKEKSGSLEMPASEQRVIGGTETILVVEDEIPLLKLIHHILESYGYEVLESSSGRAALELWELHKNKIDLLLTDLILPDGMAGRELADRLLAAKPGLKVIYTSGYDTHNVNKEHGVPEGANFIQKPFHARKLAECVYDCINGDVLGNSPAA